MLKQVILDQLSEFLMVEQGGLELYRVAASRAVSPGLKSKYEEFGQETAHHRQVLIRLIERLGGDPDYVSPTARIAQFKASKLLESAMATDGLSEQEVELNDLENVLLAETKDHADWAVLKDMAEQAGQSGLGAAAEKVGSATGAAATAMTGGPTEQVDTGLLADALREAIDEVGDDEDEHLDWARDQHRKLSLRMGMVGPAPSPQRWQSRLTNPVEPIEEFHASPKLDGLLDGAAQGHWQSTVITRQAGGESS